MERFTKDGQRIVIDTCGYGCSEGSAVQITLPNGKFFYTGIASVCENRARDLGLACKIVKYYGACIYSGINDRAHDKFPIQIDGVSVADFLDKIATREECRQFSSGAPS
jgi:hypothetical protein